MQEFVCHHCAEDPKCKLTRKSFIGPAYLPRSVPIVSIDHRHIHPPKWTSKVDLGWRVIRSRNLNAPPFQRARPTTNSHQVKALGCLFRSTLFLLLIQSICLLQLRIQSILKHSEPLQQLECKRLLPSRTLQPCIGSTAELCWL